MIDEHDAPGRGFSLKRWSRRKSEARPSSPEPATTGAVEAPPCARPSVTAPAPAATAPVPAEPLPDVETLSFDSDFAAFLRPEIDEGLKRKALAKLFRDPRFNVMDGLDVYIDDYSKPDPIPPEILRQLAHCRSIFEPPRTRVNAQGYVEDVPPDEVAAVDATAATAAATSPAAAAASGEANQTLVEEPDRKAAKPSDA